MIEIDHLTKVFASNKESLAALEDVSLTVYQGDIFGIIGMSGAGKSTLLRCLAGLEQPTEGSIHINGLELSGLRGPQLIAARRKMGVVFQGYNLLMQKTVARNIAFPLELSKAPKEMIRQRVDQLLELVGLSDKADSYPSQLSGGQKQRVALARALATSPEVLLCDEPTSALDSLTTRSVLDLLREINQTLGVTILIITHEIGVVQSICNRVAVIDSGRFVECGLTAQVLKEPKSEITKLLLGYTNG